MIYVLMTLIILILDVCIIFYLLGIVSNLQLGIRAPAPNLMGVAGFGVVVGHVVVVVAVAVAVAVAAVVDVATHLSI